MLQIIVSSGGFDGGVLGVGSLDLDGLVEGLAEESLPPELLLLPDVMGVHLDVRTTFCAGIVKVAVALLDNVIPPSLTVQPEKV